MPNLRTLPVLGGLLSTLESVAKTLDGKLPTIKGRPAMTELIANLKPGITVSLVSLPLSISLALAAGSTPVAGIITAVWAGSMSAFFGGSHFNVVGPTGALSTTLGMLSHHFGNSILPLIALLGGLFSLTVYFLRLERFFVFIPSAVMHGFTLGVAFIIAFNQLNFALGLPKLKRHEAFVSNVAESFKNIGYSNWLAVLIFASSFFALYKLQKKKGTIPWSIILAAIGIIFGAIQEPYDYSLKLSTIKSQYGDLQLTLFQVPEVFINGINATGSEWITIIAGSLSVTLVAVLETLISASIADRMTKTKHDPRAEVMAIGLANLASGLAGGIPATAALARTALNIKSGATSRAAGIVNGISITLLSTLFFRYFKFLPLPCVATILVNVAWRMIEWPEVKLLYKLDKPMFLVAILSALICIFEDPTLGIIYGALFAMVRVFINMRSSHTMFRVYQGTKCKFTFLFDNVDPTRTVPVCVAKYMGNPLPGRSGNPSKVTTLVSGITGKGGEPIPDGNEGSQLANVVGPDLALSSNIVSSIPKVAIYSLPSYVTYIAAQPHKDRVIALFCKAATAMPDVEHIAISLQETYYIDPDAAEMLGALVDEIKVANKKLYFLGFHKKVRKTLEACHFYHDVEHHIFPDYASLLLSLGDEERGHNSAANNNNDHQSMPATTTVTAPVPVAETIPVSVPAVTNTDSSSTSSSWEATPYNYTTGKKQSTNDW